MGCAVNCSHIGQSFYDMVKYAFLFWVAVCVVILFLQVIFPNALGIGIMFWRLFRSTAELIASILTRGAGEMWKIIFGLLRLIFRARIPNLPANILVQLTTLIFGILIALLVPLLGAELWVHTVEEVVGRWVKDITSVAFVFLSVCLVVGLALNSLQAGSLQGLIGRVAGAMIFAWLATAGVSYLATAQNTASEAVWKCVSCRIFSSL